jgi:hypothetical protein
MVSDDDRMESYYHEGKKLYKVPQRRLKRTDATRPMTEKTSTSQPASAAMQRQQQQPAPQMTHVNNKACSQSRQFTNKKNCIY